MKKKRRLSRQHGCSLGPASLYVSRDQWAGFPLLGLVLGQLRAMFLQLTVRLAAITVVLLFGITSVHAQEAGDGDRYEFPEMNFRIDVPRQHFTFVDPKNIAPDAIAIFRHRQQAVTITIIAEALSPGLFTTRQLAGVSQSNLQARAEEVSFSPMQDASMGILEALKFYSDARFGDRNIHYVHWVAERNGYLYQIAVTYPNRQVFNSVDLNAVVASFAQLDYRQKAGRPQEPGLGRLTSSLGYQLDLQNQHWQAWDKVEDDVWYPDLAGLQGDYSAFITVPACVANAQPDSGAVNYAFLRSIGFDSQRGNYKNIPEAEIAGETVRGLALAQEDEAGTPFYYRFYFFDRQPCKLMLGVWTSLGESAVETLAQQLLSSLTFTEADNAQQSKAAQAWFYNGVGLYYYNVENFSRAADYFQLAIAQDPSQLSYVTNATSTLNRLGQYQVGLDLLMSPALRNSEDVNLLGWRGWFEYSLQDYAASASSYERAFGLGELSVDDLVAYVNSLTALADFEQAEAVLARHRPSETAIPLIRAEVELAVAQEDFQQALAVLDAAPQITQAETEMTFLRMDVLGALGDWQSVVTLSEELIAKGLGSATVYHYLGDAQYNLEHYVQAKQAFEAALAMAPGNEQIRQYLQFTDAQLGKGNSASIGQEITPVAWPAMDLPQQVSGIEDFDSHYLQQLTAYEYDPAKPLKKTQAQWLVVHDRAGVERFNTMVADYNPLSEKLYINRLLVRDNKGNIVSEADRTSFYVADAEDYDQATFGKVVRAPVAGLAPGYSIEFVYTTETLSSAGQFPFERFYLSGARPIGQSVLYITGAVDELLYNQVNADAPQQQDDSLLWVAPEPPILQKEPMQVDVDEYLAAVVLSSKAGWRDEGLRYNAMVAERVQAETPELEGLVDRLTQGIPKRDQTQRIAALANYVQSTLTYKALEFGSRGYIPNTPNQILQDRFGDCKDHSVLLMRLLTTAGIPAELALANLSGPVDPNLPSIDQFDHMVVYLPEYRDGFFIDATNKDMDLLNYTPYGLGESHTLVLGQQPRLQQVPANSPSHVAINREVELTAVGDLSISEQVALSAYFGAGLRSHLKQIEHRERLQWLQQTLSERSEWVEVDAFSVDNLFDAHKDLVLNIDYRVKPYGEVGTGGLIDPAYWERYYLSAVLVSERQTDFRVNFPLVLESKIHYRSADALPVRWLPRDNQRQQTDFGEFQAQWKADGSQQQLRFRFELTPGRYPAADYAGFYEFSKNAVQVVQQPLMLTAD